MHSLVRNLARVQATKANTAPKKVSSKRHFSSARVT
jgi:hypothetical protein